jgi:hypothetical protein
MSAMGREVQEACVTLAFDAMLFGLVPVWYRSFAWPFAGFVGTEIGCFDGIGDFHGETKVQPRDQAWGTEVGA